MQLSLPAAITRISTMRDKTVRLQVDCQEMSSENMAELFKLNDKLGWFFFADQTIKEINKKDLPEIKFDRDERTPGQRMRAVLYVLWERTNKEITFEQYYREQAEKIIVWLKSKLD